MITNFKLFENKEIEDKIESLLYCDEVSLTRFSYQIVKDLTDNLLNDNNGDYVTRLSFVDEVKDGRSLRYYGPEVEKYFKNKEVKIDGKTIRIKSIKFDEAEEQPSESLSRYINYWYNVTFEIKN